MLMVGGILMCLLSRIWHAVFAPHLQLQGLALFAFMFSAAWLLDRRTLCLMFLPNNNNADNKVFCFGRQRASGFRFSNYVTSMSFLWGMLHVFGASSVLPPSLIVSGGSTRLALPALVAFVSFTYLATFFTLATEHRSEEEGPTARPAAGRRLSAALALPVLYYVLSCLIFLSHVPALLPTIISASVVLAASVASRDQVTAASALPRLTK